MKRLFVVVSQARIFCGSVQDLGLEPGLELKNEIKMQMSGIITISICKKTKTTKSPLIQNMRVINSNQTMSVHRDELSTCRKDSRHTNISICNLMYD